MSRTAKQAHRNIALFIGIFLLIHFAAHFSAISGVEEQAAAMNWGRALYQWPIVEAALVLALLAQVLLGLRVLRGIHARKRKDWWHKVQFASGCYLALFIVLHTTAALSTRMLIGLDTNFYWAAGTLVLAPLKYGFAPYYFLAVTALFSHFLAAQHFRGSRLWHSPALILGPVAGLAIMAAYSGALYAIELPQPYRVYFGSFPGVAS